MSEMLVPSMSLQELMMEAHAADLIWRGRESILSRRWPSACDCQANAGLGRGVVEDDFSCFEPDAKLMPKIGKVNGHSIFTPGCVQVL